MGEGEKEGIKIKYKKKKCGFEIASEITQDTPQEQNCHDFLTPIIDTKLQI